MKFSTVLVLTQLILTVVIRGNLAVNLDLINILFTRNDTEIYNLPHARQAIIDSMQTLEKIHLTSKQKMAMWEILKNNRNASNLKAEDLSLASQFLPDAPEYDLLHFNVSDSNITTILGQVEGFTQRQVALIASNIRNQFGPAFIEKAENINKILGLLCGFAAQDIDIIQDEEFVKITSNVFNNLHACTEAQLKILLIKAIQPTTYGPLQKWTKFELRKLGHILLALSSRAIRVLEPSAVEGISAKIIAKFNREQLGDFSLSQLSMLNPQSKVVYHEKFGLLIRPQSSDSTSARLSRFIVIYVLSLYTFF